MSESAPDARNATRGTIAAPPKTPAHLPKHAHDIEADHPPFEIFRRDAEAQPGGRRRLRQARDEAKSRVAVCATLTRLGDERVVDRGRGGRAEDGESNGEELMTRQLNERVF